MWHGKCRLKAAGLRCPEPILLRLHVLVMEFIGNVLILLKWACSLPSLSILFIGKSSGLGAQKFYEPLTRGRIHKHYVDATGYVFELTTTSIL